MSAPYEICDGFNIYIDGDAESPRTSMDNLGTMVCFHRDYALGDKHNYAEYASALMDIFIDLYSWEKLCKLVKAEVFISDEWMLNRVRDNQDLIMDKIEKKAIVLPLYLYDHSGITMRTSPFSCPWDSGQVGFIYATFDQIKTETAGGRGSRKLAEKILKGEVETYDQYLTGDVYGYVLDDKYGSESCWGFYGLVAAKEAAQNEINCTKAANLQRESGSVPPDAGVQLN